VNEKGILMPRWWRMASNVSRAAAIAVATFKLKRIATRLDNK
jgi:hypothetical protein